MLQLGLNNIKFYAFHGWYEEERKAGGNYLVNCTIDLQDDARNAETLEHTFDYQQAYDIIKGEMDKPRKLLEEVAKDCVQSILKASGQVQKVTVCIEKMNPPIGGEMRSFSVTLTGAR